MLTFLQAIEQKNITELLRLIYDGIDVNKPCSNGELPLKIAITQAFSQQGFQNENTDHNLQVIAILLEAGANSNLVLINNEILIFYLCQKGDCRYRFFDVKYQKYLAQKIIELILKAPNKIILNCKNQQDQMPFGYALYCHNIEVAKLLLAHGAESTISDADVVSTLSFLLKSDLELFERLVSKDKIDINSEDQRGFSLLDYTSDAKLILYLLKKGAIAKRLDILYFFQKAQHENNIDLIDYLFTRGLASYISKVGATALHVTQSYELIERLLKEGSAKIIHGLPISPLFNQIIDRQNEHTLLNRLRLFQKYKISFNVKSKENRTLLHQSILISDIAIFKFLLDTGILLNIKDDKGDSVMHEAIRDLQFAKVQLLIENGADCSLFNNKCLMPLEMLDYYTILRHEIKLPSLWSEVIISLLARYPEGKLPKNWHDLMFLAVHINSIAIIEVLLARGASITYKSERLSSVPVLCAQENQIQLLRCILPKLRNGTGYQQVLVDTLARAVSQYRYEIVDLLLNEGVDVNAKDSDGETILSCFIRFLDSRMACYQTDEEKYEALSKTLKYLLKAKIDINQPGKHGITLLEELLEAHSPKSQFWSLMSLLLKHGANLPGDRGDIHSLAKLAFENKALTDLKLIIDHNSVIERQELLFFLATETISKNDLDLLEILKTWGLQLDYQPRGYLSQGMQRRFLDEVINPAVVSGSQQTKSIDEIKQSLIIQEKFLEWFIRQGAGLHYLKPNGGYSLLHIAVCRGFLNIVKLLLLPQYGYQVDLLAGYHSYYGDDELLTPLQIAVKNNHYEIAKLLLMHNANPCVQNKKKETLLHIACDQGNEEMVRLLLTTSINKDAISNQNIVFTSLPLRPIHYAAKFKDRDKANKIVNILLEYNVIVDCSLFLIMIDHLLEKSSIKKVLVKLNKDEVIQRRTLHVAVNANNLPACELLVEYYPELLTLRDMQGCLPLHLATAGERELIFKFLSKQKDDIAVRDYDGNDVIVHALCHDTLDALNLVLPKTIVKEQIYHLRAKLIEEAEFVNANQYKLVQLLKYCYKLIELFETSEAALNFITSHRNNTSKQPIHDICLFQLPLSSQIWNKKIWKAFAQQYGARLTVFLHFAPIIESTLKRVPHNIEEIESIASEVKYTRRSENSTLAQLFIQYKIPEEAFNRVLDSYQPKAKDFLPDVTIEGHVFNEPRYYLKKLPANDPLGFVLGAATHCCQSVGSAGEACAMHGMTSEYGGFYVIYKRPEQIDLDKKQKIIKALQSAKNREEFLKFFKDKAQRNKYNLLYQKFLAIDALSKYLNQEYQVFATGEIIAQSWAWLSENDALVLDSWERLREEDDRLCEPFMNALAKNILEDFGIKKSIQQAESKADNKYTLHHHYPSFFQSSANIPREPLHNEGEIKLFLKDILSDEIKLGAAISKGDCFFDSIAQSLNQREGKKLFDVKSLRLLCDEYTKNPKNSWVEIANKKDREDHDSYLVRISFTAPELLEKEAQDLKLGTAVWGRPKIEGRIFCEQFKIRIHVIEILEDGTVNRHLVDKNGETEDYNPSVDYKDNNILHMVNYHNHFVPLLKNNISEVVEIKDQLPLTQLAEHYLIKRVLLGKGGNTPTYVTFQELKKSENPKDYFDYRDSLQQYLVKEQAKLTPNNAVVLSQGIGLFAHAAQLEVIHSYSAEQINKLLQHLFSAHKQFIVLPAIDIKNFSENEISRHLGNFKNIKINDCTKIITCIMPVLIAERFWTGVIIQRGVSFHYNNQDNWTLVNYLDFAGRAMPKELMQLLVNAQLIKPYSNEIYRSTANYITDPSVSDIWLVENLRTFAKINILNIKPLCKEEFNQIKERNNKALAAIQDSENNKEIEKSAIGLNLQ